MTRATILAPVSETIVGVETSAVGIHIVEIHEDFIKRRQAWVTQAIVDTAPGVPLTSKVTNLSPSYAHIQGIKVAKCTAALHMSLGSMPGVTKPDSVNAVQISKSHQIREQIL